MNEPKEKLTIENFVGIKFLAIEVSPFTVIIGPQSVGKSVLAKLLYFFRRVPHFLRERAYADVAESTMSSAEDTISAKLKEFFPVSVPLGKTCTLDYRCGATSIQFERAGAEAAFWKVCLPYEVEEAFFKLRKRLKSAYDFDLVRSGEPVLESGAVVEYSNAIYDVLPHGTTDNQFVPAGRAFYAQIQADVAAFFRSASLDPFVTEFGLYLARLRRKASADVGKHRDASGVNAQALSRQLLSGDYVRKSNEDYIIASEERVLPALIWSSGQQEAQPLALVLRDYCERPIAMSPLFIEEPEAHLFPASQRTMTELIALAFKTHWPDSRMFITTHSPYILTTINNLLLAGQLHGSDNPPETASRLTTIMPADRALPPGSVGAFYMDQDGCRSIMDEETGLMEASAIDEVSERINETFDALLDLQIRS